MLGAGRLEQREKCRIIRGRRLEPGLLTVTDDGLVAVNLKNATGTVCVKLSDIVRGLHDRGMSLAAAAAIQ